MITTQTILFRCEHEDRFYGDDRELRIYMLELGVQEAILPREEVQLACEAIKFHRIRLDGLDYQAALIAMGIAPPLPAPAASEAQPALQLALL